MDFDTLFDFIKDDFELSEIMEKKGSRCTKTTKQASSYVKSKKYMK